MGHITRSLRSAALLALLPLAAAGPAGAAPETAAPGAAAPTSVTVCDNLVTLRRLMADDLPHDSDDPPPPPDRTGCREVAPDTIGAVERRTLIGGAPFECRSIAGGACLWVKP